MKIDLSEKEFKKLTKLLYIWMFVSQSTQWDEKRTSEMDDVFAKFMSFSDLFGLWSWDFNEDMESLSNDKEISEYMANYSEEVFSVELLHRLVAQDMIKKYWQKSCEDMSQDDLEEKEKEFLEKWTDEISNYWISRIWVVIEK